ncbi:DNA polymerase III subunit delta [Tropheryma whipplei]|uniref:DNA polymerase III subunit delta n=1 Tax=Tropheryma whipplei TaxID=2039 RepID=UPI0004AC71F6|nr:DNA polymerase III subunit delta [Tropheryma whipplei]
MSIDPLVLLSGKCEYSANEAIASIRKKITDSLSAPEVHVIYADNYSAGELHRLASPSLLFSPRLVIVKQVEECNDIFLDEAMSYIQDPFKDTCVVFRHKSGIRGKRLLGELRNIGVEIACPDLTPSRFVSDFFKKEKRNITQAAINLLVESFDDIPELAQFCKQIISDTKGTISAKGTISECEIAFLCWSRPGASVFRVVDAAMNGDEAATVLLLSRLFTEGGSAIPLVAAASARLRLLVKVKYGKKVTAAPWQIALAKKQLAPWTNSSFMSCILALHAADRALKSTAGNPNYLVEHAMRLIARSARLD